MFSIPTTGILEIKYNRYRFSTRQAEIKPVCKSTRSSRDVTAGSQKPLSRRHTVPAAAKKDPKAKNGLMMEPEGKHRNSLVTQRILAMFGLMEIVLRCYLTMNDFQGLKIQPEGSHNGAGSLEAPSSDPESQSWSKYISGGAYTARAPMAGAPAGRQVARVHYSDKAECFPR
ncbi:hypothetical protein EVAR_19497_1 [Eumeta japonica]|uniref:Uncharacterized protein n=1 Tax=Eumeta variegata TaxID=151549 RepID=A0A4C1V9A7_EUMVA|nr:hypothetical protein EVAR_19497_1 [Eumeta japonica]